MTPEEKKELKEILEEMRNLIDYAMSHGPETSWPGGSKTVYNLRKRIATL